MARWYHHVEQTSGDELAGRLGDWLQRVHRGVFLFREGQAVHRFDWGDAGLITTQTLSRLWRIRLFCLDFDLAGHRVGFQGDSAWRLSLTASEYLMTEGVEVEPWGLEQLVTMHARPVDQAGSADVAAGQLPRLSFPSDWSDRHDCGLVSQRYRRLDNGQLIIGWKAVSVLHDALAEI